MKKLNLVLILILSSSAFSSFAVETFKLTEDYLNVSKISLQGSQLSSGGNVGFEEVEDDALNFLANGEKTEALIAFLSDIRAAHPKFEKLSDQELLQVLLASE